MVWQRRGRRLKLTQLQVQQPMKQWLLCRVWATKDYMYCSRRLVGGCKRASSYGTFARFPEPGCSRGWGPEVVAVATGAVVVAGVRCFLKPKIVQDERKIPVVDLEFPINGSCSQLPPACPSHCSASYPCRCCHHMCLCHCNPMVLLHVLTLHFMAQCFLRSIASCNIANFTVN